jgi:hypothetical protein
MMLHCVLLFSRQCRECLFWHPHLSSEKHDVACSWQLALPVPSMQLGRRAATGGQQDDSQWVQPKATAAAAAGALQVTSLGPGFCLKRLDCLLTPGLQYTAV